MFWSFLIPTIRGGVGCWTLQPLGMHPYPYATISTCGGGIFAVIHLDDETDFRKFQ